MLVTIGTGAAQNPVGVAIGATAGHLFATFIAVIGGSLISKKISERLRAFVVIGCSWLCFVHCYRHLLIAKVIFYLFFYYDCYYYCYYYHYEYLRRI